MLNINGLSPTGDVTVDALAGNLSFMAGKLTMDQQGNLTLATGHVVGNSSFRDAAILPAGTTALTVNENWVTPPTSLTLTPSYNAKVWVESVTATGFVIKTDVANLTDEKIYWVAIW